MIEAFSSALSGLRAYTNQTSVTASNIANVNTSGYKSATATTQSQAGNMGVTTSSIQTSMSQGSIVYTGSGVDMAISGSGFIQVVGPGGEVGYTRAGSLSVDSKGRLTDMNGNAVQGRTAVVDSTGSVTWSNTTGDIYVGGVTGKPKQTSSFNMGMNLDASANAGDTFNSTVNLYNSLGEAVPVTYSFTKTGAGTWDYTATAPAGLTLSGAGANGTLSFDQQGQLTSPAGGVDLKIDGFSSGAGPMTATMNLNVGSVTSYSSPSTTTSVTQDGGPGGAISGFSVSSDGVISAIAGGQSQPVAQVSLYNFSNPNGLERGGGNVYYETSASGQAISGQAGSGGMGDIVPGSLEMSNVDIGEQMVGLIQSKYGFSAQTKVIKATDDMLGSLMDIVG